MAKETFKGEKKIRKESEELTAQYNALEQQKQQILNRLIEIQGIIKHFTNEDTKNN